MKEWKTIFEAINVSTMFAEGCSPLMEKELRSAWPYVEKLAADPSSFDERKSDQVIRLLHQSAEEMEACHLIFMAADIWDAAETFKKLGYPKVELRLVR